MKCLLRNKSTFYYAPLICKAEILDEYGNVLGIKNVYGKPVKTRANVSPATGMSYTEQFGASLQYDKVIVLDDVDTPIDESSVLCVDSPPSYNAAGDLIFDYIVKRVARSLNSVSIAISKVVVS